jgi:hypothetical protein
MHVGKCHDEALTTYNLITPKEREISHWTEIGQKFGP